MHWPLAHPNFDLTESRVAQRLQGWVLAGQVDAVIMHLSVVTFSGTPMGVMRDLPNLWAPRVGASQEEKGRVLQASTLLRNLLTVVQVCQRMQVPLLLTSHASSLVWRLPEVQRLTGAGSSECVNLCCFGGLAKRRTRLCSVGWNLDIQFAVQPCFYKIVCSTTGKKRMPLCGVHASGIRRVAIHSCTPGSLARLLAQQLECPVGPQVHYISAFAGGSLAGDFCSAAASN
eukprot:4855091-Amphidinium_carterae.1